MKILQAYFLYLVWICNTSILGATLTSFLGGVTLPNIVIVTMSGNFGSGV